MEVNDDLQTVIRSPANGFLEVWELSVDVGLSGGSLESPIADGDANMIQAVESQVSGIDGMGKKLSLTHPAAAI